MELRQAKRSAIRAAAVVAVLLVTGGQALAHHREGHGGGPKPHPTASPTPSPSPTPTPDPSPSPTPDPSSDADLAIAVTDEPDPWNGLDPSHEQSGVMYTIEVTNKGPAAALDVTMTAVMQVSGRFSRSTTTCGTNDFERQCDLGSLAQGASAQVTLKAIPCSDLPMVLEATVGSGSHDPNTIDNSETEVTTVIDGNICTE